MELLQQVVETLVRAGQLKLSWSGHVEGEAGSIAAMRRELEAVRGGELRMSVVAPMKAGKSTLVNSIVGYELLPARAAAMTTLPTRIVLERRIAELGPAGPGGEPFNPVLDIKEEDADRFNLLIKALRKQLTTAVAGRVSEQYPHLGSLVRDIADGAVPPVLRRYEGRARVQEALTLLNDLMRLAGRVLPPDWRAGLSDVPVVRTPYWSPQESEDGGPGHLVVIDTPGPDEYELSEMLGDVVSTQLSESHIVLVVLDYTKMGGQSDARIRELMRPLLARIGPGKLFAVVNKIDQKRHETDLDDAGIVRSVSAHLGLADDDARNRVFTTSAEWALAAVQTLAALRGGGTAFEPASDDSAARLLKLVYPMHWEEELEDISAGGLRRVAHRAWEFSRLQAFLTSAVAWLRRGALRLAIGAALDKAAAELQDLEYATLSRRDLIGRRSHDLHEAARHIAGELSAVAGFRDRVTDPAALATALSGELRRRIKAAREDGRRVIKNHRDDMKADARSPEGVGWGDMNFLKSIFQRDAGVMEFSTSEAAEECIRLQTAGPKAELDEILERARKQVESSAGASAERQVRKESEYVRPVVRRAAERVKDEFSIEFTIPEWELQGNETTVAPLAPESEAKKVTRDVQREVHRRSWRRLWFWPTTYTMNITEVSEEQTYLVRADVLTDSLRASFESCVDEIEGALDGHVREMIAGQIAQYYDRVEAFLHRYRAILQQSAADNTLEERKQAELRETLNVFHTRVRALQGELEQLRGL
ncbi:dynamin family protein [Streptomyces sp. NPDC001985]|uniref:dynamin family protein n=1 Tax=Streptomyces sp. NPDC001985 TaxID=3154406 RepID=UPI0033284A53